MIEKIIILVTITLVSCRSNIKLDEEQNSGFREDLHTQENIDNSEDMTLSNNKEIRAQDNIIDSTQMKIESKLSTLDSIKKVVFNNSSEGSELTGYLDENNDVIKLRIINASEFGNVTESYFYHNNRLIKNNTIKKIYSKPIFEDVNTSLAGSVENHYYFKEEKLIKWLSIYEEFTNSSTLNLIKNEIHSVDRNNVVIRENNNYSKEEKRILVNSKEYLNLLNN